MIDSPDDEAGGASEDDAGGAWVEGSGAAVVAAADSPADADGS